MATNQMKNLMTEQPNGFSILCAPDCDGSFVLYEDDGVSMDYEKGCYLKTFISMAAGSAPFSPLNRKVPILPL